jgi:hypothetical protein
MSVYTIMHKVMAVRVFMHKQWSEEYYLVLKSSPQSICIFISYVCHLHRRDEKGYFSMYMHVCTSVHVHEFSKYYTQSAYS